MRLQSNTSKTKRIGLASAAALGLLSVLCANIAGCGGEDDSTGDTSEMGTAPQPASAVGSTLISYEMSWPVRSSSDRLYRASEVLSMFVGRRLAGAEEAALSDVIERGGWRRPLSARPELAFKYYPNVDEIRVRDTEFERDQGPDTHDIGEAAARSEMRSVFQDLAARRIIRAADYDLDTAKVAYTTAEVGDTITGESITWHDEYRFIMTMRLDGHQVVNNYVHIGIKRGGGLAAVRLGGVQVNRKGIPVVRTVGDDEIAAAFAADTRGADSVDVLRNEIMYVLPDDVASAVVEPARVYSYSLLHGGAASRRKDIGYSLTRAGAKVDYQPPNDRDQGDKR